MAPPRLAPDLPLPASAYVPGRQPRPGRAGAPAAADRATPQRLGRYALDLFNHGYYWEAHEAWEALWRTHGRDSREGRLLRGLIGLAAAGVKARQGNARGAVRHARRAAALFRALAAEAPVLLRLEVAALAAFAETAAAAPPMRPAAPGAPPEVVFGAVLRPAA